MYAAVSLLGVRAWRAIEDKTEMQAEGLRHVGQEGRYAWVVDPNRQRCVTTKTDIVLQAIGRALVPGLWFLSLEFRCAWVAGRQNHHNNDGRVYENVGKHEKPPENTRKK